MNCAATGMTNRRPNTTGTLARKRPLGSGVPRCSSAAVSSYVLTGPVHKCSRTTLVQNVSPRNSLILPRRVPFLNSKKWGMPYTP